MATTIGAWRWRRCKWRPACGTNAGWNYWRYRAQYEISGSTRALRYMLDYVGLNQPDLDNIAARPTHPGRDTCPNPSHYKDASGDLYPWRRKRPVWHPAGYCNIAGAMPCGNDNDEATLGCHCPACDDKREQAQQERRDKKERKSRERERYERELARAVRQAEREREQLAKVPLLADIYGEGRQEKHPLTTKYMTSYEQHFCEYCRCIHGGEC